MQTKHVHYSEQREKNKRGRIAHPEEWDQPKRKVQRNSGEEYYTKKNHILIPAREVRPHRDDCTNKCTTHFSAEKRREILDNFNSLGKKPNGYDLQQNWILSCVQVTDVKRHRKEATKQKTNSRIIRIGNVRVCKDFFLGVR